MHPKHTHKLYCYVDETGQDTMVAIVVAIVVADSHRDDLQRWLEVVERESGKKTKWMNTSDKARHAYIEALVQNELPAQYTQKSITIRLGRLTNWKYLLPLRL